MLIKLQYPLISPTNKLILIVSFHIRQETIKKSPCCETVYYYIRFKRKWSTSLKNLSAFNIGESSTRQQNAILNGVSLGGRKWPACSSNLIISPSSPKYEYPLLQNNNNQQTTKIVLMFLMGVENALTRLRKCAFVARKCNINHSPLHVFVF